uniref:Phostensin n=1 Tax=Gouania willdenowi TaxID=441366 RepID=A0A8C5GDB3_GOUWI
MSVTLLPEWKQLLLERKRREEEERGRREKEEEEKFANMPAWKRGIIQRRKAKSPTEGLSDTDSSVTANLGSEPSLSPDPGIWLDTESKVANQVSLETIVPVHENPFIRTQCVWRKGRDGEGGNELEVKEREKWTPRIQDGDMDRGHDVEQKLDSHSRHISAFTDCSSLQSTLGGKIPNRGTEWALARPRGSHLAHSVLSQHTEELINKIEQIRDTTVHSNDKEQGSKASHCIQTGETAPTGLLQGSLEVQIPRTVFYVAKELSDKKKSGQNLEEGGEPREKKQEMPEMSHKSSRQQVCSPTSHSKQTFSVTPSFVRSRSPDNFLRATDCAPTPASSPCSPSPSQSPNISPSPSPSPTLFSIRSASGGPVKRGATITITPKKTVLGAAMGHTVRPMASKKKYPTVEEIEVIGGYENLERSCLIKKGGTPKRVSKDNKPEKTFFIQCYSLATSCFLVFLH